MQPPIFCSLLGIRGTPPTPPQHRPRNRTPEHIPDQRDIRPRAPAALLPLPMCSSASCASGSAGSSSASASGARGGGQRAPALPLFLVHKKTAEGGWPCFLFGRMSETPTIYIHRKGASPYDRDTSMGGTRGPPRPRVTITDERRDRRAAPLPPVIVTNHTSLMDCLALGWCFGASFVAAHGPSHHPTIPSFPFIIWAPSVERLPRAFATF